MIKVSDFKLSKWYLDFTPESGEAMIFYSAKLTWRRWTVSYTSWLNYNKDSGVTLKSRLSDVQIPEPNGTQIKWADPKFGVSGTWDSVVPMIEERIYDSAEGYLDWKCYQPSSKVRIQMNESILEGDGYAEQLTLTLPPWKVPMDELRWGRFVSPENNLVWIELREKSTTQWLWLNGNKIGDGSIEDDRILIPEHNLVLNLDRGVILESEKKILSLAGKIIRYIPGFNKAMPVSFLNADETKWLSKGSLKNNSRIASGGMAIHEFVKFNSL